MNVSIIGCGGIGMKRARALGAHKLIATADTDLKRAAAVAAAAGCREFHSDWEKAAAHKDADIVIVSTTNDWLTPIGLRALEHGKHVLVEKPCARSAAELEKLAGLARKTGKRAKAGFNLRYHPALLEARRIADTGELGPLMFVRGRYGHGGRLGYDKEWRADQSVSGGGELIDQGVHLIDLARWFLGDFKEITGWAPTYFWNMPVDDNGFMALRAEGGRMAWLHASCTEWKNLFCLEIYGKHGKIQIDGLGGSYGTEKLTYHKMRPEMGPPDTTVREYPGEDASWREEFAAFVRAIETGGPLCGGIEDAVKALSVVDAIYGSKSK